GAGDESLYDVPSALVGAGRAAAARLRGGRVRPRGSGREPAPGSVLAASRRVVGAGRTSDPEPLEQRLVATPARPHLDAQLEEDVGAERVLDLGTRAPAPLLDQRPAAADHDLLLRFGLDEDVRLDGLLA